MSVNGIDELPAYLDFLRTHPGEAGALLKDLLISVTNFFRDRDAFDALEAQIPALFAGKTARRRGARLGAGVRHRRGGVLDRDAAGRARAPLEAPPALQVFATDLDEDAIRGAREGVYPAAIAADVSRGAAAPLLHTRRARLPGPQRAARGGALRRPRPAQGRAVLAPRPGQLPQPASSTSNREAQQRALEIVHFALRPHGRLFLGVSETVDVGAAPVPRRSTRSTASTSRAWCASAALPPVSGDGVAGAGAARCRTPGAPTGRGRRPACDAFLATPAEPGGRRHRARGASCT